MKKFAWLVALSCTLSSHQLSSANPALDAGVAEYKLGHYEVALKKFLEIEKTEKKNYNARYYAAACYQALRKYLEAQSEYEFVYENAPNPLKEDARVALSRLGVYLSKGKQRAPQPNPYAAPPGLITGGITPVGFKPGQGSMIPGAAPSAP